MSERTRNVEQALRSLREYVRGNTVQPGMFSVLDETVANAPFERNTGDQWLAYLQPGRMLQREGVQFPLRAEELRRAGEFGIEDVIDPDASYTREELRNLLSQNRQGYDLEQTRERFIGTAAGDDRIPENFPTEDYTNPEWEQMRGLFEGLSDLPGFEYIDENTVIPVATGTPRYGAQYGPTERLRHVSPDSAYEESVTRMQGLTGGRNPHFGEGALSWSRTSTHDITDDVDTLTMAGDPSDAIPVTPAGSRIRLVEEIQSDLAQAGATPYYRNPQTGRVYPEHAVRNLPPDVLERLERQRIGFRTEEDVAEYEEIIDQATQLRDELEVLRREGIDQSSPYYQDVEALRQNLLSRGQLIEQMPPDIPFQNPREYGALELRKQLLNAVDNDEDYLALVRGRDQIERYGGQGAEGHQYIYDKIYLGELQRLARRYGAEIVDVQIPLDEAVDVRSPVMRELSIESGDDLFDYTYDEITQAGDAAEAREGFDDLINTMRHMQNRMEGNVGFIDPEGNENALHELMDEVYDLRNKHDQLWPRAQADEPGAADQYLAEVDRGLMDLRQEFRDLYEGYEIFWGSKDSANVKDFPAIRLTDEVKERIRAAGVPQYKEGGPVKMQEGGSMFGSAFLRGTRRPNMAIEPGAQLLIPPEILAAMTDDELAQLAALQEAYGGISADEELENQAMFDRMRQRVADEARLRDPEYWKQTARRIPATMASMWKTLNQDTGEAEWRAPRIEIPPPTGMYGYMPTGSPETEEARERINAEIRRLAEEEPFRPGIIDDTIAMRGLLTAGANLFRDEPQAPPEYAAEAMERSARMMESQREQWDLPEPQGLPAHAAEGLGAMIGQVPTPKSLVDVVGDVASVGTRRLPRGAQAALKWNPVTLTGRAALEFMDPTVSPSLQNYLLGAGFGATLGSMTEPSEAEMAEMRVRREQELSRISDFVENNWDDQSDEVKMQMLSNPDRQVGDTIWNSLTPAQQMEALQLAEEMGLLEEDDAEQE